MHMPSLSHSFAPSGPGPPPLNRMPLLAPRYHLHHHIHRPPRPPERHVHTPRRPLAPQWSCVARPGVCSPSLSKLLLVVDGEQPRYRESSGPLGPWSTSIQCSSRSKGLKHGPPGCGSQDARSLVVSTSVRKPRHGTATELVLK
jgi:hypothetical protein